MLKRYCAHVLTGACVCYESDGCCVTPVVSVIYVTK